jgi:hypothetical protein
MREHFKTPISSLVPLFWLKTEDEDVIRCSIARMSKAGASGFILENRNNPLYLSEKWWRLVGICLDEAKQRNMKLWLWDEKFFPSGTAGGAVMRKNSGYSQKIIEEKVIYVANGKDVRLSISDIIDETEDKLFAIFACKQDSSEMIQPRSLVKLELSNDMLEWQVPEGDWLILIYLVKNRLDWVDVLNPDATQTFIDLVYEEAYRHFSIEFGNTFAGFFSDETGLRNVYNYYSLPGKKDEPLPWTTLICKEFASKNGYELDESLPALWHDIGESTKRIRRDYMDTVSHLFAENFFGKIHNWCEEHSVQFIGHVIEDNGAHYRLGHGCAHYFRVIEKFHIPGVDIVLKQVLPGETEQKPGATFETPFFYWVLGKLASSASHIYNVPENLALLEAYGAYGWYEGLRMIKWLTDWALVRGINVFTPHAFNPKYPDTDCPPHFGLEGIDPQWQYFNVWSDYANRMSWLLRGGIHIAPVVLLYPAESLWTGDAEPIEDTARSLLQSQIDFDFVPYDCVINNKMAVRCGELNIGSEYSGCLVVPPIRVLHLYMLRKLRDLASEGGRIVFVNGFPTHSDKASEDDEFQNIISELKLYDTVKAVKLDSLISYLRDLDIQDIDIVDPNPNLRYIHRIKEKAHIFGFFNESLYENVKTEVVLRNIFGKPERWEPLNGYITPYAPYNYDKERGLCVPLFIEPYQSVVIFVSEDGIKAHISHTNFHLIETIGSGRWVLTAYEPGEYYATVEREDGSAFTHNIQVTSDHISELDISGDWKIEISTPDSYPKFREEKRITGFGDFSDMIPNFSGTVAYERDVDISDDLNLNSDVRFVLDLGEAYEIVSIFVNSHKVTEIICPHYRCDISQFMRTGRNYLRVEVTNTLANAVKDIDESFSGHGPFPFGIVGPVKLMRYKTFTIDTILLH